MKEDACILSAEQRKIVETQIEETCRHRGWTLHAVSCRSNHLHAVISARGTAPTKVRQDVKAWCSRRLREGSGSSRANWWAERGSIRWIYDDEGLDLVRLLRGRSPRPKRYNPTHKRGQYN
jgi:REP element-mobilizing transposase RayT